MTGSENPTRRLLLFAGFLSIAINLLTLLSPLYLLQVFDRVLTSRSEYTLALLTIATIVAFGFMAILDACRAVLLVRVGNLLDRQLSAQVFRKLVAMHPGRARQEFTLRDLAQLRRALSGGLMNVLFDLPWAAVFTLVIFLFHWLLGWVAVAGMLVLVLLAVIDARWSRGPAQRAAELGRGAATFAENAVRQPELVRAMGLGPAAARKWAELSAPMATANTQAADRSGILLALTRSFRLVLQVLMLAAGAYLVLEQKATAGVMTAATIIVGRAVGPVEQLLANWRNLVESHAAWKRLRAALDLGIAEAEPVEPRVEAPVAPDVLLQLDGVSIRIDPRRGGLTNLSLKMAPGEMLAVTGPSASGKSLLAGIIAGLLPPQLGLVRFEGHDIATMPPERLGQAIGYLPQEPAFLPGTVGENIARFGADATQASIEAAARLARAHERILQLPEGYATPIGDGGVHLPAGLRQSIALARTLYGPPRLAVLDEPEARLDLPGRQQLVETLRELRKQRIAVVYMTQAPELIQHADRMLMLQDGLPAYLGPVRREGAPVVGAIGGGRA
jgi:ATP-binding cassette subfamily C exporter for protease/lipase